MEPQANPIKFTTSQILEKPSEKNEDIKFTISVEAHVNAGEIVKKDIQVENLTSMTDIKIEFANVFFPSNPSPSYDQLALVCNDIVLDNKLTISNLKKCLGISDKSQAQLQCILKIHWTSEIPVQVNTKIVLVWIDPNFIENKKTYNYIAKIHKIEDKMQMIQLASNEELTKWLEDNIINLRFWYEMRRVFFISNMNRAPNFKNEGLQTLKIIRNRFEGQSFVFYIGSKNKCMNQLKENLTEAQLKNFHVFSTQLQLKQHFRKDFLNQLYINQSFIDIPIEDED